MCFLIPSRQISGKNPKIFKKSQFSKLKIDFFWTFSVFFQKFVGRVSKNTWWKNIQWIKVPGFERIRTRSDSWRKKISVQLPVIAEKYQFKNRGGGNIAKILQTKGCVSSVSPTPFSDSAESENGSKPPKIRQTIVSDPSHLRYWSQSHSWLCHIHFTHTRTFDLSRSHYISLIHPTISLLPTPSNEHRKGVITPTQYQRGSIGIR